MRFDQYIYRTCTVQVCMCISSNIVEKKCKIYSVLPFPLGLTSFGRLPIVYPIVPNNTRTAPVHIIRLSTCCGRFASPEPTNAVPRVWITASRSIPKKPHSPSRVFRSSFSIRAIWGTPITLMMRLVALRTTRMSVTVSALTRVVNLCTPATQRSWVSVFRTRGR